MMKVFVGNVGVQITEVDLRSMFQPYGEISGVNIVTDRVTGQPRGFAFVEMMHQEDAAKAIVALQGTQVGGRSITVNEAKPKR